MKTIASEYYSLFDEEEKLQKGRLIRILIKKKVSKIVIGVNIIAKFEIDLAIWLGYSEEEAKTYSSHCFRRTAATIMTEKGSTIDLMKTAKGWTSSTAAEGK